MRLPYLLTGIVCGCLTLAAQEAPAAGARPRPQMPDPSKPAGEAFKNVQLLKDVPAGEFFQTMRRISASLGSRCDLCHVQGDFASDEKPEKKTARTMITMVRSVNQQFFDSKNEVTCFTCHRGSAHPVSTPPEGERKGGPGGAPAGAPEQK